MEQTMTILLKACFSIDTDGQSVLFTFRGLAPVDGDMTLPVPTVSTAPTVPVTMAPAAPAAPAAPTDDSTGKVSVRRLSNAHKTWNPADDQILTDMYQYGASIRKIAATLGRSASSVQNRAHLLRKTGKPVRNRRNAS